jgi:hypothetical protein
MTGHGINFLDGWIHHNIDAAAAEDQVSVGEMVERLLAEAVKAGTPVYDTGKRTRAACLKWCLRRSSIAVRESDFVGARAAVHAEHKNKGDVAPAFFICLPQGPSQSAVSLPAESCTPL